MTARSALVVRTGALGDLLLLRRTIATLQDAAFRVTLLAPAWAAAALVGAGRGEAAACLDSDRADLASLWAHDADPPEAVRRALGHDGLAYVVSADQAPAASLARAASQVVQASPAPPSGVHASEWLARPLGLAVPGSLPSLAITGPEIERARPWRDLLPDGFVAIHPGSGSPRKNWPASRFVEVARALARDEPFAVVSGPADALAAAPLLRLPNAVSARDLPLRVLAALLGQAGVFLGNDSGVSHLAAAAGAPTLALFGPTDPVQWAPVGTSVRTLRADPLDALSVADVAEAAATLWERAPRSS